MGRRRNLAIPDRRGSSRGRAGKDYGMKYKVSFTSVIFGFFGNTVVPGAEIITADDIQDAWEKATNRAVAFSDDGQIFTVNNVEPLV